MSHFQKILQMALYVAAARAFLSPPSAATLRFELEGPLEEYKAGRYDESDIIDIVDQLMPDGWKPASEWEEALKNAGFTRGETGK